MGNRKGISSEELFGNHYEKSEEIKAKYTSLSGAKAISSDMFFGSAENQSAENGLFREPQAQSSTNFTFLNKNLGVGGAI